MSVGKYSAFIYNSIEIRCFDKCIYRIRAFELGVSICIPSPVVSKYKKNIRVETRNEF